jgi:hypothetical protein
MLGKEAEENWTDSQNLTLMTLICSDYKELMSRFDL